MERMRQSLETNKKNCLMLDFSNLISSLGSPLAPIQPRDKIKKPVGYICSRCSSAEKRHIEFIEGIMYRVCPECEMRTATNESKEEHEEDAICLDCGYYHSLIGLPEEEYRYGRHGVYIQCQNQKCKAPVVIESFKKKIDEHCYIEMTIEYVIADEMIEMLDILYITAFKKVAIPIIKKRIKSLRRDLFATDGKYQKNFVSLMSAADMQLYEITKQRTNINELRNRANEIKSKKAQKSSSMDELLKLEHQFINAFDRMPDGSFYEEYISSIQ